MFRDYTLRSDTPRGSALLLNSTAETYHWGSYGSTTALVDGLAARGYEVTTLPASATATLAPTPACGGDCFDDVFFRRYARCHPELLQRIACADLVVVNGEGTLHGRTTRARNLLYVILVATRRLGRPTWLVNHSCYPSASPEPCDARATAIYRAVYRGIDFIAARETRSLGVISNLGRIAAPSFDGLARYIADRHPPDRLAAAAGSRHGESSRPRFDLVVAGGVALPPDFADLLAAAIGTLRPAPRRIGFLTGGRTTAPPEDRPLYEALRARVGPLGLAEGPLGLVEAPTMESWLDCLARARVVVSGRFHHSLAAACLRTPFVAFASNTPKVDALCAMLGVRPPFTLDGADPAVRLGAALTRAADDETALVPATRLTRLAALAGRNLDGTLDPELLAARGETPRRTENGEARGWQGARREHIGPV